MRRLLIAVLLSLCIGAIPVLGGETHVIGAVTGTWIAGESIYADGAIYVPANAGLVVEHGVHIHFKTDAAFVIGGSLEMLGNVASPIVLSTPENWAGFMFHENGSDVRTLRHVEIGPEAGLPLNVVTSENSWLDIDYCKFRALEHCLEIRGGRILAHHNHLVTTGLLSKTVILQDLTIGGLDPDPCLDEAASSFSDNNMIWALVEYADPIIPAQEFTAGLAIRNCNRVCLSENIITVSAPGTAIGAYFTYDSPTGDPYNELRYSIVSVRSPSGQPHGIYNANRGVLQVIHCNVDVANPLEPDYMPLAMTASDYADIYVNSTIVQLNRGDAFFHTRSLGEITVSHVWTWQNSNAIQLPEDPAGEPAENKLDISNVQEEGPVYFGNPQFQMAGAWGSWTSPADVEAYYSLLASSPCIDSADVTFGYDPDNSLPDIGRYYFHALSAPDPSNPADMTVALAPAYPNPFNSTTVLPFTLNRFGRVGVTVYDLLGRQVAVRNLGPQAMGHHEFRYDAQGLPTGMYIVSMQLDGATVASQPILLIK